MWLRLHLYAFFPITLLPGLSLNHLTFNNTLIIILCSQNLCWACLFTVLLGRHFLVWRSVGVQNFLEVHSPTENWNWLHICIRHHHILRCSPLIFCIFDLFSIVTVWFLCLCQGHVPGAHLNEIFQWSWRAVLNLFLGAGPLSGLDMDHARLTSVTLG